MTEAIPNMDERIPIYTARLCKGTENPIIVAPPEKMADAPIPDIALPAMSIGDPVDTALIMDPTWVNQPRTSFNIDCN